MKNKTSSQSLKTDYVWVFTMVKGGWNLLKGNTVKDEVLVYLIQVPFYVIIPEIVEIKNMIQKKKKLSEKLLTGGEIVCEIFSRLQFPSSSPKKRK